MFQSLVEEFDVKQLCLEHDKTLECLLAGEVEAWQRNGLGFEEVTHFQSKLKCLPKNVSAERHSGLEANSPGINVPEIYIDSMYAVNCLRSEDQALDSAHLMIGAAEGAERIFLIVHHRDLAKCASKMQIEIARLRRRVKGGRSKWGSPDCIMPYQNGDFIFSTQWYDEEDIAYVLVRLMPGDLIYIKPGLLYQQISTGFNVIESVDVGSSLWAAASYFFFRCPSDIEKADYVALNIDVYPSITDHYVKAEECYVSECQYITNNKDIMNVHGKSHVHE